MGDAALDAEGAAVFFAPAGADAWRGDGVGVDAARWAAVFAGVGAGFAADAEPCPAATGFFAAGFNTGFDADCAGAALGAAARGAGAFFAGAFFAGTFFAEALVAEAVFAGDFATGAFFANACLVGALGAGAFFAATLVTDLAAFFATTFLATTFFAVVFFAAGFFAGAAFLAAFAAFFAGFFAATGGVSFYSLVTGKRAVIPCRATCSNRTAPRALARPEALNDAAITRFCSIPKRVPASSTAADAPAHTRGGALPAATFDIAR